MLTQQLRAVVLHLPTTVALVLYITITCTTTTEKILVPIVSTVSFLPTPEAGKKKSSFVRFCGLLDINSKIRFFFFFFFFHSVLQTHMWKQERGGVQKFPEGGTKKREREFWVFRNGDWARFLKDVAASRGQTKKIGHF